MSDSDSPTRPICIKVPEVIGVGECQVVIVSYLTLSHKATEIKRVSKKVLIDNWVIGNGKVLINGTVHKNVEYERDDHVIGSDKFDVHFDCCLDVFRAACGDSFQLEAGRVCVEKDELIPPLPSDRLFEKLCVGVVGKVTREIQVTITPSDDVCPTVPSPCGVRLVPLEDGSPEA